MTDQTPPIPPLQPSSETGAMPTLPPKKSGPSARTWIIAGVVTLIIAGGAIFALSRGGSSSKASASSSNASQNGGNGANGGPGGRGGGFTRGTIDTITGSKLSVTATDGTITNVVTDSSTTVSLTVDVTVADVAVGDQITVQGTVNGTDIAADQITDMGDASALTNGRNNQNGQNDQGGTTGGGRTRGSGQTGNSNPADPNGQFPTGPPNGQFPTGQAPNGQNGQRPNNMTFGQVTAVKGSIITITGRDGTTSTVTVSSATKISKTKSGTLADLKKGDTVTIVGQADSKGVVTASRISEGAGGPGGFGGGFGGGGGRGGQSGNSQNGNSGSIPN